MHERLKVDDKKNNPDFSKKLNKNLDKDVQDRMERVVEANEEVWEVFSEAKEKIFSFFDEIKIKIDKEKIDSLKIFITERENAFFDSELGFISVTQKNLENKERLIHQLVHETLHFLSANKINFEKYTKEFNDMKYNVMSTKVGYNSVYNLVNKDGHISEYTKKLFTAFNEGITESLTSWIMKDDKEVRNYGYAEEVWMVEKIKDNIYENEDNKFPRKFLQEYFDGGMMHLRKIEKFYGKGSLRLLAFLTTEKNLKYNTKDEYVLSEKLELRKKILEFFTSDDLNKREELRKILIR